MTDLTVRRQAPPLPLAPFRAVRTSLARLRLAVDEFIRRERERRELAAMDEGQLREIRMMKKCAGGPC